MEHKVTTTPFDTQHLLQQQLADALTLNPGGSITLPRSTVSAIADHLAGPAAPPSLARRYQISADDLRPAVIAEMQRLARDGEAASKRRWDLQRRRSLPSAQHTCRLLACGWHDLITAAGLALNPHARRRYQISSDDLPAEPAAVDDSRAEPADNNEPRGLEFSAMRTETIERGDRRIIREIYTLR